MHSQYSFQHTWCMQVYLEPQSFSSTWDACAILLIAAALPSVDPRCAASVGLFASSSGGTVRTPAMSCAHLQACKALYKISSCLNRLCVPWEYKILPG